MEPARKLAAVLHSPPVRLAVQTAVAALVTFAIARALGLREQSWAVIGALFVVQPSIGGTLNAALGRILGSALGTALGLGWILLGGTRTGLLTAAGLFLGGAVTTYVAGRRPTMRYGSVMLAIMLLSPGGEPFERAAERAFAIMLGTVIGALASELILPFSARSGADAQLGRAVSRCADLLAVLIDRLTGRDNGDVGPVHADIRGAIDTARSMSAPSRLEKLHGHRTEPSPGTLDRAVERLWHAAILIDRADDGQGALPEPARARLTPALDAARAACCRDLRALGQAIVDGAAPPAPAGLRRSLGDLDRALEELRRENATKPLPGAQTERVFATAFGLQQVARNADEIMNLLDGKAGARRG